ncbi:uncharacterized protein LOC144104572 isoform X2 [Amblyomma americanum]
MVRWTVMCRPHPCAARRATVRSPHKPSWTSTSSASIPWDRRESTAAPTARTPATANVNSTGFVPHFVSETCDQKFATQDLFETRRQHEHPEEPPGKTCVTFHERTHTGEQSFVCRNCGKGFKQSCDLTAHMAIHEGDGSLECTICGQHFSDLSRLTLHRNTVHNGQVLPHSCSQCGMAFREGRYLRHHERVMHGRRYVPKCPHCGRISARLTNLRRHMRLVHDSFGEDIMWIVIQ